jgi:hypothetical protein
MFCEATEILRDSIKNKTKWIKKGLDNKMQINCSNKSGEYPLLMAYDSKDFKMLDLLLKNGANINFGGYQKIFLIFVFIGSGDLGSVHKYEKKLDFTLKNLKWNTILHHYLLKSAEQNIDIIKYLYLKIGNINHVNIDGNTIFHLINPDLIVPEIKFFTMYPIDILIRNKMGYRVLDLWYQHSDKKKLLNMWYKSLKINNKILKKNLFKYEFLDKIEIEEPVKIFGYKTNNNNIYSAFLDNLIIYICYIYTKYKNKLFIPIKNKKITYIVSHFDSTNARTIKFRMNAKENMSIALNNFIEYYSNNTYYFPKLPDKFPQNKFSFYLLSIVSDKSNHTNIIIIDPFNKIIERFDSEGYFPEDKKLDKLIFSKFKKHKDLKNYDYIPDKHYDKLQNHNLFQLLEVYLNDERPGDPVGYCSAWSLWYLEQRMNNPTVEPLKLYEIATKQILSLDISIRDYIRSYTLDMVQYKNKLVEKELGKMNRNKDFFNDEENYVLQKKLDDILRN